MATNDAALYNTNKSKRCACCMSAHMMCWRACKWIPVLLITSIVVWSYYAFVIQLCIFTITSTVQQCVYLVVFHVLLIMFLWSYAQTIFTEIKPIPDKYKLPGNELEKLLNADTEDDQRSILENFAKDLPIVTRTNSGSVRYCNRCVLVKPDRAHHCSICARCNLKMDHHCPWVNNCVCFYNYKFFLLFLGYAVCYCLFIMSTCLPYFIKFWKGEFGAVAASGRYHIVFVFFVSLMFALSLGSLFSYHCYLVAHNRTTLDLFLDMRERARGGSVRMLDFCIKAIAYEAFRAPVFHGGPDKRGFSLGALNNFKEVFGDRVNLWFFPVFTSRGNGCDFPVRAEHEVRARAPPAPAAPAEPHGYESMGTTRPSAGEGAAFARAQSAEDAESLLSGGARWDRWAARARPFDTSDADTESYDEL